MSAAPTILALSSPPGRSARAILRLSGPAVGRLLAERFGIAPRAGAHTGLLALSETASLPVLLAFFPAPRSYTGEDLLEVQLPGNPTLVERISALFLAAGDIRPAEPGEFTARAFLNHKLTLDQAEGIALAIAAEGESDLAAARRLASGQTGSLYRAWSDELATLLALVEAGIDFTDQEDVVPIPAVALSARLEALAGDISARLGARRGRESGSALPLVALVGAPNAGKSTLFNALLGRRRAVTSPVAGTTRDVLVEPLDLSRDAPGSGPVMLADLAGIDRASGGSSASARGPVANLHENLPPSNLVADPLDARAQSTALSTLARADLLIYCDPNALFAPSPGVTAPTLRIRTKADLVACSTPPSSESPPDQQPHAQVIPVCALDGRNLAALRRHIALAIRGSTAGAEAILAPRHRLALAIAADRLADAIGTIGPARGANLRPILGPALGAPELTAGLLREALDSLGELTGRVSPDDVIGRVFATFCVGK